MRMISALLFAAALSKPALAGIHWPGPTDVVTPHATGLHLSSADGTAREGMPFGSAFHSTLHTLVAIYGHDIFVGFA